ncbi:MAG: hypothetical protein WBB34_22255 [Xanthobacteraceae bacterium]
MQKTLLLANRAIATGHTVKIGGDLEAYAAAMTSTFVSFCSHSRTVPGFGVFIFHSLAASIQDAIASCTSASAASGVSPSEAQARQGGCGCQVADAVTLGQSLDTYGVFEFHSLSSSWPGLSSPSTSLSHKKKAADARHKAGHDGL